MKIVCDNEQKRTEFLKSLPDTENEQHLLSQMINAQSELSHFSEIEKFIEWVQLGARFVLDTFVKEQESIIRDII